MFSLFFLPEILWVFSENEAGFFGEDVGISVEEEVFDPTDIAVGANSLAAVAERVGRAGSVFFGLWEIKEIESFGFETGHELHWDAMVDNLEESEVFAGFDNGGTGLRVRQVHHGDSIEEARGGLA